MKNILLIGSGGLRVGQAGEFDYSGSQAIKAFKEEDYKVILINPNIATVQTDNSMADKTHLLPLNLPAIIKIIKEENIQLIALGFGGQTALNLGLELETHGILKKYGIGILGSSLESIKATEDRELFKQILVTNQIKTPISMIATTIEEAAINAEKLGYPLMLRSGYSLGGLGSGKISNEKELVNKVTQALAVTPQVLLEEYLYGWKEFEYEIVRDKDGNALTICNMENMDPMGIHTGESIVVAPAQTLNNREHQLLRDIALKCAEIFGIIGECNIQFAVNPDNGDYRVIEMNPRLSRSSALASKATGYPLAYVAAKLCLGIPLYLIKNNLTQATCAYFEPAMDYIVVKIPRWDTHKFPSADRRIGTEMKSVGEVMGVGRSFPEALQKAIQMLNIGASCLHDYPVENLSLLTEEIEFATDKRIFAIYQWLINGNSLESAHQLSKIDKWFLSQIESIAIFTRQFAACQLDKATLLAAKQYGLSDKVIGTLHLIEEAAVRKLRIELGIIPKVKQIDTVAGEMVAYSNYLYLTYYGNYHDLPPSREHICILGSGPYSIGSSVEFDWCTVNMARQLRKNGRKVIIINSNPETVSTDHDESDRLYFEPLSSERVADILDFENCSGTIICTGGQIANNLAPYLAQSGYPILGTQAKNINQAEDRQLFAQLMEEAGINQPRWIRAREMKEVKSFVEIVGYPVIVRPSYVLSGSAMKVIDNWNDLINYLEINDSFMANNSVVIAEFINDAKEIEVDGISQDGTVVFSAISEHIENAGVHSGDATVVYPAQNLSRETIEEIKAISKTVAAKLELNGPFNMQLMLKNNNLLVIECNVRASRSLPFIAKVGGENLIEMIADIMLNKPVSFISSQPEHIGVKTPVFSYNRFKGADPVAQVEMASTGEVACIGQDLLTTFYQSWLASGQSIRGNTLLVNLPDEKITPPILSLLQQLIQNGWQIAGNNNCTTLKQYGLTIKNSSENEIIESIKNQKVSLVINVPVNNYILNKNQGEFKVRRSAIDYHVPLITNLEVSKLMLQYLAINSSDFILNKGVIA